MTSKKPRRDSSRKSGPKSPRVPRRPRRRESTLTALEACLQRRTSMTINGEVKQVSAGDAILLQLMHKSLAGDASAMGVLLQYFAFAGKRSSKSPELRFPENEYTRSLRRLPADERDD